MNCTRGSIWRRCDLHIHTPESHLCSEYGSDWDYYVKQIITEAVNNEIEIIGITDYFTIEGYKKLKNEYLSKPEKMAELFSGDLEILEKSKSILFLPNIEFRLNKLVGQNRVNFHVIFSDKVSINDIEENFLHDLSFVYQGNVNASDTKMKLKSSNLEILGKTLKDQHPNFNGSDIKIGMLNAVVDDTEIMNTLYNNRRFTNKYLTVVPCDEDLSQLSWNGQDHNVRKVIIQKSNLLFSSNTNTRKWGLGEFNESKEEYISEFKSLKPCIHGSDAHNYENLFNPDHKRFCWIKADPTFEGLQQILYEPEDRVKITEANPNYEYDKPFFESLQILKDYSLFDKEQLTLKANTLSLNKNLVSIIGGRGSGKSMLINSLSNIYGKSKIQDLKKSNSIKIIFSKNNLFNPETIEFSGDVENTLDYLFISQGDLRELLSQPKRFSSEIGTLLNLDIQHISQDLQNDLDEINTEIENILKWFDKTDEENKPINSVNYNENIIESNNRLLSNVTTKDNSDKLKSYSSNIEMIRNLEKDIKQLEILVDDLNSFSESINTRILTFDTNYQIPIIEFELQLTKIKAIMIENKEKITNTNNENLEIKETFKEIYTGDLSTLLSNVDKYKTLISSSKKQIEDIKEKKELLIKKRRIRVELNETLQKAYESQSETITGNWNNITNKFDDPRHKKLMQKILSDREIEIHGCVQFDTNEFLNGLKTYLSLTQYRKTIDQTQEEKISADFPINSYQDFFNFISNGLDEFMFDDNNSSKTLDYDGLLDWFYNSTNRSKYLYTTNRKIQRKNFRQIISWTKRYYVFMH